MCKKKKRKKNLYIFLTTPLMFGLTSFSKLSVGNILSCLSNQRCGIFPGDLCNPRGTRRQVKKLLPDIDIGSVCISLLLFAKVSLSEELVTSRYLDKTHFCFNTQIIKVMIFNNFKRNTSEFCSQNRKNNSRKRIFSHVHTCWFWCFQSLLVF